MHKVDILDAISGVGPTFAIKTLMWDTEKVSVPIPFRETHGIWFFSHPSVSFAHSLHVCDAGFPSSG